jgi:hypothetical protein
MINDFFAKTMPPPKILDSAPILTRENEGAVPIFRKP